MLITIATNKHTASANTAGAVVVFLLNLKGNNFINFGDLLGVATN